jgi:hypothetical protein
VTDIYLVKTLGGALKPIDGAGEEYVKSLGSGEIVLGRFKKARILPHHNKFFGILRMVFNNQEKYLSEEGLRKAITIQAGYVERIDLDGERFSLVPMSIAFEKMDQTEFNKFYDAALLAIPALLPQFEGMDLDRELLDSSTT